MVLQLFLVNPGVFVFEWRRPWYQPGAWWSNLTTRLPGIIQKQRKMHGLLMTIYKW